MPRRLGEIIQFRSDKLFNGSVNIDWFNNDEKKSQIASRAFVFHGPKYHGVIQSDVGIPHGHVLVDTATFALKIIKRVLGKDDEPFTLAIAGYGAGKSHLALTLATLLKSPDTDVSREVIKAIESADEEINREIQELFDNNSQPNLVIAINGIGKFDLSAEIAKQVVSRLRNDGVDVNALEELRPRFAHAISLIQLSSGNAGFIEQIIEAVGLNSVDEIIRKLEDQDEFTYSKVFECLDDRNLPIRALGGETVKDFLGEVAREYCGPGKPYRSIVILFDEFGQYLEFATVKSHIAGSGVLQELFEVVQTNSQNISFVGFIQSDLQAYIKRVGRMGPEYRNEIQKYVSRFEAASDKYYLSSNLETLVANLIEKRGVEPSGHSYSKIKAEADSQRIARWFPTSQNYRIWRETDSFKKIISQGCWPFSPYSVWLMFYLAAAGKILQERSAISILGEAFKRYEGVVIDNLNSWSLLPVDLWTESFYKEMLSSEESGEGRAIAHALSVVIDKHYGSLTPEELKVLQAVVLALKMGLKSSGMEDYVEALSEFTGIPIGQVSAAINNLSEEYQILEWDERFKTFDIISDAVPRTQFIKEVKRRALEKYDEEEIGRLFMSRVNELSTSLCDIESDFGETHKIYTKEWSFLSSWSNVDFLPQRIQVASKNGDEAVNVDDQRGTVIYTYVGQSQIPSEVARSAIGHIREAAKQKKQITLPIIVVLLFDENGELGRSLAEYSVLDCFLENEAEKSKYESLVGSHRDKLEKDIESRINSLLLERRYVTGLGENENGLRLLSIATDLFSRIYSSPIDFPFDGFGTRHGNAANTCFDLTRKLLNGVLDYQNVMAMPQKEKNRACQVLKDSWGIFLHDGSVSNTPKHPVLYGLFEKWQAILERDERIPILTILREICSPPYGANIASAGLALGVFLSPRKLRIVIERQDGTQRSVQDCFGDSVFKGKYLNFSKLEGLFLRLIGKALGEWEALLDKWELAVTHVDKKSYSHQAVELQKRIPLPPQLTYRYEVLQNSAKQSINELMKYEDDLSKNVNRLERGKQDEDISMLTWGTLGLKNLSQYMSIAKECWEPTQVENIRNPFVRAKELVIEYFPSWINRQRPKGFTLESVADFRQRMDRVIDNLKKLSFTVEAEELEEVVRQWIIQIDNFLRARELLRSAQGWIEEINNSIDREIRIFRLRNMREQAKEYVRKMDECLSNTFIVKYLLDLEPTKVVVVEIGKKIEAAEEKIKERIGKLWDIRIQTEKDIAETLRETDFLIMAYEGIPKDQRFLEDCKAALIQYRSFHNGLSSESLNWAQFYDLAADIKAKHSYDEEGPPWDFNEMVDAFVQEIEILRIDKSLEWITSIENAIVDISEKEASEVNNFWDMAQSPPAVLTDEHRIRLEDLVKKIDARRKEILLECIVEMFKNLPEEIREKFLKIVGES